jgi:hypothetical protein
VAGVLAGMSGAIMKKAFLICLFICVIPSFFIYGEKLATLTDVLKPEEIVLDKYLYVTEKATIYVYDKTTFKLIKKFGQAGEGPREFKNYAEIIPLKNRLLINSAGKISYFTKEGEFIREIRTKATGRNRSFWPLGNGYVGQNRTRENNVRYYTVNLYDKDLNRIKEIYRMEDFVQPESRGKIFWPPHLPRYFTHENKVVVAGKAGFVVDILNQEGEPLITIEDKDYERRKFTAEDKKLHLAYIKEEAGDDWPQIKQILAFEKYFPEILAIFLEGESIYIFTWKFKNGKYEVFEYDMNGKRLKTFYLNLVMEKPLEPYPNDFKNGNLYQLIENEDENWDLIATKLEQ